jgi:RNAse (barnase) inhibitor barstar
MSIDPGMNGTTQTAAVQVIDLTPEATDAVVRLAQSLGLDAVRIDLDGCSEKSEFLERTAAALGFPAWFGGNWDAFFDCLADLGWRPARGHVLVFENTADMRRHAPEALDTAITILADAAVAWDERGKAFRAFVGSE